MKKLELLSRDELSKIHEATMDVLETVGVNIFSTLACNQFKKAGANVDDASHRVKVPRHIVEEAIKTAPRTVKLCGRNPKHDIELTGAGEKSVNIAMGGRGQYFYDLETGQRRSPSKRDIEDGSRIANALENIHVILPFVYPFDVPTEAIDRHSLEAMLNNTEKPIMTDAINELEGARDQIEMATVVAGSREELRNRPLFSIIACLTSPLQITENAAEVIMEMAKNGLPVHVEPDAQAGATAPVTLAGALVQTNAEVLAAVTLTQLVSRGTPVVYGVCNTILDMRTGNIALGAPEMGLLSAAGAQLAHHYGLPDETTGGNSNSKILDMQAAYEKIHTSFPPILAKSNLVHMMAGQVEAFLTSSHELLVMDNEAIGAELRTARGIDMSDEALDIEVIRKVGPGGIYINQKNTLTFFRREHWIPKLFNRQAYEAWAKDSSKDTKMRARERAKQILATHQPEPLPKDVQQELRRIVEES